MDIKRAKFAKQLMEEIASLIHREIKDPRLEGLVITGLELSEDMSVAKVYFTTLEEGKEEEGKKALEHAKGYIRSQLMKSLRVKRMPNLVFIFDKELKRMERIWEKL
ncbi:MAG: 30S ribosome-binding factor RbfA [Aquificaceae bacterium]|nr:30S ribosome-binding factor RbfA [Aquificaceae bacterium]